MREGTEEKGLYRDRNRNGGRERSMEANGIAGKSVEQQENINTFPSLQRPYRLCACVCCGLWGWRGGADLSAIVNTCVQASSRPFTWRLKEAQHQRFMAPREEKEVCY